VRNLIEMPASSTQPIVVGDMRLMLVDDCALVSVSTDAMRTAGVIELLTSMGYPLPGIEQNIGSAGQGAFWMGPHQWMLWHDYRSDPDWAAEIDLQGLAATTEQTDAWARFDLSGSGLLGVMERLCNLDSARIQTGLATRTQIHHMGVFVVVVDAVAQIYVPRSMADSLVHAVAGAIRANLAVA
jgi:sarcosine oxidase subunit gamma